MFFVRRVAIVGFTLQSAELLANLVNMPSFQVVRIIDPAHESLHELETIEGLNLVIDTTDEPQIVDKLYSLMLGEGTIMSAADARRMLTQIRTALVTSAQSDSFQQLLSIAVHVIHADFGACIFVQDSRKMLLETHDGRNIEFVGEISTNIQWEYVDRVFVDGKAILQGKKIENQVPVTLEQIDAPVSHLVVPVKVAETVIGVLYLISNRNNHVFDRLDQQKIEDLCGCFADILGYSDHLCESHESHLDSIFRIVSLPFGRAERIHLLVLKMAKLLKAKRCNYYSYNYQKQAFFRNASSSIDQGALEGRTLKLNDHLARKALLTHDMVAMHIKDMESDCKKWYLVQPLMIDNHLDGVLYAHLVSDKKNISRERKIFSSIASILNHQLKREAEAEITRVRSVRYSAILEACFDLAKASSSREVAQLAAANACLIMEAQGCFLRLVDQHNHLPIAASFTLENDSFLRSLETMDELVSGEVLNGADFKMVYPDSFKHSLHRNERLQSGISMPLSRDGRKFGTLSLYNRQAPNPFGTFQFSSIDKDIFLHFCLQTAKAFDRFL